MLSRYPEYLTARDQHFQATTDAQQIGNLRCGRYDLLEIVENQQHLAGPEMGNQFFRYRDGSLFRQGEFPGDGR